MCISILSLLVAAVAVQAHFVLQIPTSLGFDDDAEVTAPCGGFDPTNRDNITAWPIHGAPIGYLTTHTNATFEFNAALLSDLDTWVPLTAELNQIGVGDFCEPQMPGIKKWAGRDAVLQVIQHGPDGELYQCAAIKFVHGGPAATPSDCTNSTGTSANWL